MRRLRSAVAARLRPGRLLLAAALVAGLLAILALAESDPPGAPADHAASLVPPGALVYVHASVRPQSDQWERATRLVARFPRIAQARDRLLRSLVPGRRALDLERDVYPWLGDEAALALLRDGGRARSLILLEVSDRGQAQALLARAAGAERRSRHRGTTIRAYGQLATAFVGRFLVIGRAAHVRSAIDASLDRTASLASDEGFARSRARLPDRDRVLSAYASRSGLRRVVIPRADVVARLAQLADEPGLIGVAASVEAGEDRARLTLSSALERGRAAREGAVAARFEPQLLDVVSADAVAYVGMRGPARLIETVASVGGGTGALSLPRELRALGASLGRGRAARLLRQLAPLLDEESALFVSRSTAPEPVITLVVDDIGEDAADAIIERVLPLLGELLERPAAGQVPTFSPRRIAGVDAATLTVSPALELTYAIFGGRVVVSTSPGGIRRVKAAHSRLPDNPLFRRGADIAAGSVTAVVFLDLEQLLALGEQVGLGGTASYRQLQSELAPIRAVSAATRAAEASRTADISIEVQ